MSSVIATLTIALQEVEEENDPADLIPAVQELVWGAIAFFVLFAFVAKFVMPRMNQVLEQRRERIQGEMERAEAARREADNVLGEYRQQLANAREEANRIIEEARRTAEQMRRDLVAKAEQENQSILARAQEEIRAERDRVFQELKVQVGELSLALAGRVVGESLDRDRHLRLVDSYIEELSAMAPSGNGGRRRGEARGTSGLQAPPDAGPER